MTDDTPHDPHCEAEFILEAGGYTDCGCTDRAGAPDPALRNRHLPDRIQAALHADATRILAEIRPHRTGPLAQSAANYDPHTPSPWRNGTDPEIDDGTNRNRRPPKFIHPTNNRMAPRRADVGLSPRACARVRQIAQWLWWRAAQIARFVTGRHRR